MLSAMSRNGRVEKWSSSEILNVEKEAANLCPQCTFFDSFHNNDRANCWSCTNELPPVCKVAYPSIAHAPATNYRFLKYDNKTTTTINLQAPPKTGLRGSISR